MSVYEITLQTDLWLKAHIHTPTEGGPTATELEVLESTEPTLPSRIELLSPSGWDSWDPGDRVYIIALQRWHGGFSPLYQKGVLGIRDDGTIALDTAAGPHASVVPEFAWKLVCDTRMLVDGDGTVSSVARKHWLNALYHGKLAEAHLALDWLEQLKEPGIDPTLLAARAIEHHKVNLAVAESEKGYSPFFSSPTSPSNFLTVAASTVARSGNAEAAAALVRVFLEDLHSEDFQANPWRQSALAKLLLTPATDENTQTLGAMLGDSLKADGFVLNAIAQIPGTPVDELLWRINQNSETYGAEPDDVWKALACRNDPRLRPYLMERYVGPGAPTPWLQPTRDAEDLRRSAWECLAAMPVAPEDRAREIRALAKAIVSGDDIPIRYFGHILQPEDVDMAEELSQVRIEHTGRREMFYRNIICKIPAPAFIPLLKSWSEDGATAWLVEGLVDFGEAEAAFELAREGMKAPLEADRFNYMNMYQEAGSRLYMIAALARTPYKAQALAWLDEFALVREWEEKIRAILGKAVYKNENLIRSISFQALLTRTQADPESTLSELRQIYDDDDSLRPGVALCLYALGDSRGMADVTRYREGRDERGDEFAWAHEIILRMKSPLLDALLLERIRHNRGHELILVNSKPPLVERLGAPLLQAVLEHLEGEDPLARRNALYAGHVTVGPGLRTSCDISRAAVEKTRAWNLALLRTRIATIQSRN